MKSTQSICTVWHPWPCPKAGNPQAVNASSAIARVSRTISYGTFAGFLR